MGGLGQTQVKALGQEHERVEEAARQRHVVVDHQQPVVALGGMLGEQRVEVLEAAPVARVGLGERDRVARAQQFRASGRQQVRDVRALHGDRQHATARPSRRGPAQPRAQQREQVDGAGGCVPHRGPGGRTDAEHEP